MRFLRCTQKNNVFSSERAPLQGVWGQATPRNMKIWDLGNAIFDYSQGTDQQINAKENAASSRLFYPPLRFLANYNKKRKVEATAKTGGCKTSQSRISAVRTGVWTPHPYINSWISVRSSFLLDINLSMCSSRQFTGGSVVSASDLT